MGAQHTLLPAGASAVSLTVAEQADWPDCLRRVLPEEISISIWLFIAYHTILDHYPPI